jgi:hypothetical protein
VGAYQAKERGWAVVHPRRSSWSNGGSDGDGGDVVVVVCYGGCRRVRAQEVNRKGGAYPGWKCDWAVMSSPPRSRAHSEGDDDDYVVVVVHGGARCWEMQREGGAYPGWEWRWVVTR